MAIRLNRYLSESGYCSRREADGIIASGIVTVNGELGEFGSRVGPSDIVAIDGERIMPRRAIDFTPKEAPKSSRPARREAPRIDKVPVWLKEMREKNPDKTPARVKIAEEERLIERKPKPKSKPRTGCSKSHTPKKKM